MMLQFRDLVEVLPLSISNHDILHKALLYSDAKASATKYQESKGILFMAFSKADLGSWVKKPLEQDMFQAQVTKATEEENGSAPQ